METSGKIPHVTTQTFNVSMVMTLLRRTYRMLLLLWEGGTDSVFLQLHVTMESRFWMLDAIKFISYKDLSPPNHTLTNFQPSGFTEPFPKK